MIRSIAIDTAEVRLGEEPWRFAETERTAIARHWQALVARKSSLWNGPVLICTAMEIAEGRLQARLAQTDYASFVAWRDWGWPDRQAWNCFAVPAVVSADGALLMGVMAPWTLNAGRIYPPSGSLEPRDAGEDGRIDLRGSMITELREETGLDLNAAKAGEMVVILDGQRIAVAQRHDHPMTFAGMQAIFDSHQASETEAELSAIEAVRHGSENDSRMPGYAQEIVRQFLSSKVCG